jgi:RNA polymerase sigma-70 factor (ECF subfamily)
LPTAPITRPSLLVRIRDTGDAEAWHEFVELYAPVIYGFYRKRGLQDADAADLTQAVLQTVLVEAGRLKYDPARGSFRSWLFTIARNKHYDFIAHRKRSPGAGGNTSPSERIDNVPAREEEVAQWEQEYERRIYAWAAERVCRCVDDTTWEAFRLTAVEGKSGMETADALGMSVGAVYVAKSRVLAHLRREVKRIEGE